MNSIGVSGGLPPIPYTYRAGGEENDSFKKEETPITHDSPWVGGGENDSVVNEQFTAADKTLSWGSNYKLKTFLYGSAAIVAGVIAGLAVAAIVTAAAPVSLTIVATVGGVALFGGAIFAGFAIYNGYKWAHKPAELS